MSGPRTGAVSPLVRGDGRYLTAPGRDATGVSVGTLPPVSEAGAITAQTALAWLLASWPRRIALAVLLLIPVLVLALGGFRPADPPPRDVAVGESTDTGAYMVVPHGYFVSDQVDAYGLDDGQTWVGVVVDLQNQGPEPIYLTFDDETFRLPEGIAVDDGGPYEALRLDTSTSLGDAQPGLTYPVALLWRAPAGTDPAPELTMTMNRTIRTESNLEAGYYLWRATGDTSDVALPQVDVPAQILAEEEDL